MNYTFKPRTGGRYLLSIALLMALVLYIPSCSKGGGENGTQNPEEEEEVYVPVKSHYPKARKSFRIVTYNIGNFGKYISNMSENVALVADLLKELDADVVGLTELDSCNTRHWANQARTLAVSMGNWQWYFGRAIQYKGGAYGNGVIVPPTVVILNKYTVALPNPTTYESRSIAVVETDKYVFGACHLDHSTEDYIQTQIAAVNAWAAEKYTDCKKPVFLVGDMNAVTGSAAIKALETSWEIISANENSAGGNVNPTRCIDYIFHYRKSAAVKVVGGHTPMEFYAGDVTQASDHHPVYADIEFL